MIARFSILRLPALLAASAVLLSSCGEKPPSKPGADSAPAPSVEREPADPNLPRLEVTITGNDQMKFDTTEITARAGQEVAVTLKNVGSMPKISMGHNWVLLEKDADVNAFLEASMVQMTNEYLAPERMSDVIAHTKLLGPGEEETATFAAPREPGTYPYLCTFPGHYAIGMKGSLVVE